MNNASVYLAKRFTDYSIDDLRLLLSVNIEGFFFITQLAIRQMMNQGLGGSIVNITTTLVGHPIADAPSSVPMIAKGGLQSVTRSLAIEYVRDGIRVSAVAPGIVDTPMNAGHSKDFLQPRTRPASRRQLHP